MSGAKAPLPGDAAQLCLWRRDMPAPTVFVVEAKSAHEVRDKFAKGEQVLTFQSYPDGSGRRSDTTVKADSLDAVTVEYATLKLASVIPNA